MSQVPSIYGPRQGRVGLLGQPDFNGGAIYPQTPVYDAGGTPLANSLEQTLGLTARVFGQVAAGEDRRRQMQANEIEANNKMALAEQEIVVGEARKQANMRYADIQANIESGRIARQAGESYADFAARVAAGESQGMGELYTSSFAETIGPQVALFAQNVEEKKVAEARAASVQVLADSATLARDPDGVRRAIEAGAGLVGEERAVRAIGLPALQAAAQAGDQAQFQRVKDALGNRLVQEQGALEVTLGERMRGIASDRRNQFIDDLATMNLSGAGFGEQLAYIGEGLSSGRIDPSEAERLTNNIESAMMVRQKQALEQADKAAQVVNTGTLVTGALQDSLVSGGLSGIASEEFTFTLPSGKVQTVKGSEVIQQTIPLAMQKIAASAPDAATGLQRQALWLGSQNLKYDPLASQLSAGTSQAITTLQTVSQDGKNAPELPQSVTSAVRTATILRQTSQAVYEKHTTQEDRAFYDSVRIGLELGKTEQQAIMDAAKAASNPLRFQPIDLTKSGIYNSIRSTAAMGAVNGSEVESFANERVRYFINSQGIRADKAAELVAAQVESQFKVFRSVAVNTAGLPENVKVALKPIVDEKSAEYFAAFGDSEGVSKNSVALVRDANTGNWRFINRDNGRPLLNSDRMAVNDAIIDKIIRDRNQAEAEAARKAGIEGALRQKGTKQGDGFDLLKIEKRAMNQPVDKSFDQKLYELDNPGARP